MSTLIKVVFTLVLATSVVHASQEQIHPATSVTLVAHAGTFGDVEVTGKVGAAKLNSITIKVDSKMIKAEAAWLDTLPVMTLTGMEIRSERGYGPKPILYVVLHTDPTKLPKGATEQLVHLWIEDGKLTGATITTTMAKGASKTEQRKGPTGTLPGAAQKPSP